MRRNPIVELSSLGQSVWLDFLQRGTIRSGQLARWIDDDGVRGVTTNPTIFEHAILGAESHDYDDAIHVLASRGSTAAEIYEALTVRDVQLAADAFRPTYEALDGRDGFVSLEVSPRLAHDTDGTVAQGSHLWQLVDRPNVMIKVPATPAGLGAITRLLARGINVNVTLLFGLTRYEQVVGAFVAGLEARRDEGGTLERLASVASFFLSRIDTLVDAQVDTLVDAQVDASRSQQLRARRGGTAVALAKLAYQRYHHAIACERFAALARAGARPQRLLWASTSAKDPSFSDVKYVEALIGPDTVTTLPRATLDAWRDHGAAAPTLERGVAEARRVVQELHAGGVDLMAASQRLEGDGVAAFERSYDKLLHGLEERRLAVPRRAS